MEPRFADYPNILNGGWKLMAGSGDNNTMFIFLTNDWVDTGYYEDELPGELLIDLGELGYMPKVYHDGGDAPPMVLFHANRPDLPPYVWEQASGRIYRAGTAGE